MAREHGYVVTVKMFVPVNRKSLQDTKDKADAIFQAQQSNDLSGLAAVGADVMKVDHRFTSREKAEAETEHPAAETVEQIEEQAQGGEEQPPAEDPLAEEEPAAKSRRRA